MLESHHTGSYGDFKAALQENMWKDEYDRFCASSTAAPQPMIQPAPVVMVQPQPQPVFVQPQPVLVQPVPVVITPVAQPPQQQSRYPAGYFPEPVWQRDEAVKACNFCNKKFTLFFRRHRALETDMRLRLLMRDRPVFPSSLFSPTLPRCASLSSLLPRCCVRLSRVRPRRLRRVHQIHLVLHRSAVPRSTARGP